MSDPKPSEKARIKNKNVIITQIARSKLVKARAGIIQLPTIDGMAFGDGGVDEDGVAISPTDTDTTLKHEIYRKKIDGYELIDDFTVRYTCTLEEKELAGEYISEIALYDTEGDIVCIKTFTKKGKDDDMEQAFVLDDIF